jgi:hypothetical protein
MTKPRRFTAVAHMWCEIRLGTTKIQDRSRSTTRPDNGPTSPSEGGATS